jgi:hypothetical protein
MTDTISTHARAFMQQALTDDKPFFACKQSRPGACIHQLSLYLSIYRCGPARPTHPSYAWFGHPYALPRRHGRNGGLKLNTLSRVLACLVMSCHVLPWRVAASYHYHMLSPRITSCQAPRWPSWNTSSPDKHWMVRTQPPMDDRCALASDSLYQNRYS